MDKIRPEFPDPSLARKNWINLNGLWDFLLDPKRIGVRERWAEKQTLPGRINVPFCLESEASGVGSTGGAKDFWYLRRVNVSQKWRKQQIWLRIGAADYACRGYINGQPVGAHEGGFTPIAWRIDQALRDGDNTIVLHVSETTEGRLPRGKQTHLPFRYAVFYRPFSGIWQPVWLEARGTTHLQQAHAVTDPESEGFIFHLIFGGKIDGRIGITLSHPDGKVAARKTVPITAKSMTVPLIPKRKAWWSPDEPNLYDVKYIIRCNGKVVDQTTGYAGLRTVAVRDGEVLLNGKPLYQKLVLYQAYYPQGWVTAVDDATLRADIELIKSYGFNGLRIHQTLADPRLLYWCDRLGLLAWGEMPSCFVLSRVDRLAFENMLRETLARDLGHPSLITWVLFNETWGVLDLLLSEKARQWVRRMVELCRELDPSRPVIDNSGYDHLDTDILDIHHYMTDSERIRAFYRDLADPSQMGREFWRNLYMLAPNRITKSPLAPTGRYDGQPVIISECGGHGFGPYGGKSMTLEESFRQVITLLAEHRHLRGFCYTQLFDVEQEQNGLANFERRPKIDPARINNILSENFPES